MNLKQFLAMVLMGSAVGIGVAGCATLSSTQAVPAPNLEETIAAVAQWEYGRNRAPLVAAEQALNACRTDAQRAAAEAALLKLARDSAAPRAARQFALQQLGRFGTETSVEPLLQLLADSELGPDAAAALDRMRTPATDRRLRERLSALPPPLQAHVLRILGNHADAESVSALEPFVRSDHAELSTLAVRALGRIGSPAAADLLIRHADVAARAGPQGGWDAMLSCLDAAVQRGDRLIAERCLVALDGAGAPDHVRAAAALATAPALSANEQLYRALTMLGSTNGAMRAAGIQLLRQHGDPSALTRAAGALAVMPADSQIALLGLLEDRAITAAERLILPLRNAGDPAVRAAALRALGTAGTAESVGPLAEAAARGTDEERGAARRALRRISGQRVNERMAELLHATAGDVRLELLRAIGDRGVSSLAPTVFALTDSADEALRHEAIKQAGALAGTTEWPRLLDKLTSATNDADRAAWLGAAEAAAIRLSRASVELTRRWKSAETPTAREALLALIGRLRPPDLLPAVAQAASSAQPNERHAAIRALSRWADAAALPPLIAAARHPEAATRRLAQRGLVQVLREAAQLRPAERVAHAAEIAVVIEHADEQKALLAILADAATAEAAAVAARFLDQPAVRAEAELAILRSARAAGAANRPPVRAALERIARESESADRREEAAKLLSGATPPAQ